MSYIHDSDAKKVCVAFEFPEQCIGLDADDLAKLAVKLCAKMNNLVKVDLKAI